MHALAKAFLQCLAVKVLACTHPDPHPRFRHTPKYLQSISKQARAETVKQLRTNENHLINARLCKIHHF